MAVNIQFYGSLHSCECWNGWSTQHFFNHRWCKYSVYKRIIGAKVQFVALFEIYACYFNSWGSRSRGRMEVGFTASYLCNQCLSSLMLWVRISIRAWSTTLCGKVCQWLAIGQWISPGPPVSSTNKTDRHDITEILLKVALNTIKQRNYFNSNKRSSHQCGQQSIKVFLFVSVYLYLIVTCHFPFYTLKITGN